MALQNEEDDFASAFGEGVALDSGEVTEDMTAPGGLDIEEAVEEQSEAEGGEGATAAEVAEEVAEGEVPGGEPAEEAAAETGAEEGGPTAANPAVDLERERQRLRSWEGRLKAREAELNSSARGDAPAEGGDAAAAVQEAAAEVGSKTPVTEVLARLAEDFGEDFVDALSVLIDAKAAEIAGKVADEKVGALGSTVDGLIHSLTDERAKAHFEAIADAHPDFMEIHESPAFNEWIDSLGERTEEAKAIVESGSARQINKLLTEYKEASKAGGDADEVAMDGAQSVSSRAGMRLPNKPVADDDYESAWNAMN